MYIILRNGKDTNLGQRRTTRRNGLKKKLKIKTMQRMFRTLN